MAATSHDFWNNILGPRLWKGLHMGVYAAYGLLVGHVIFGAPRGEAGLAPAALAGASALLVSGLHTESAVAEAIFKLSQDWGSVKKNVDVGLIWFL